MYHCLDVSLGGVPINRVYVPVEQKNFVVRLDNFWLERDVLENRYDGYAIRYHNTFDDSELLLPFCRMKTTQKKRNSVSVKALVFPGKRQIVTYKWSLCLKIPKPEPPQHQRMQTHRDHRRAKSGAGYRQPHHTLNTNEYKRIVITGEQSLVQDINGVRITAIMFLESDICRCGSIDASCIVLTPTDNRMNSPLTITGCNKCRGVEIAVFNDSNARQERVVNFGRT